MAVSPINENLQSLIKEVQTHRGVYIFEAIVFILLGMLAFAVPGFFTVAVELFFGWLLLFGGLVQGYRSIKARTSPDFWAASISSLIFIICGVLLLVYPLQGVLTLTALLSIFFCMQGIAQIIYSIQIHPLNIWGWFLLGGLLNFGLALLIWYGWPSTAVWMIGLLLGINMMLFGFTLLMIVLNIKKLSNE